MPDPITIFQMNSKSEISNKYKAPISRLLTIRLDFLSLRFLEFRIFPLVAVSEFSFYLFINISLNDITYPDVIETLYSDATFKSFHHLFDVVLEPPEGE